MKNKLFIIILLFLASCGYTAQYKNLDNNNFKIEIKSLAGNKEINMNLENNLNQYTNKKSDRIFFIDTKTEYTKRVLSKDLAGTDSNYELNIKIIFNVNYKDQNKIFIISEKSKIDNMTDNFEESNYEKIIKRNLTKSITNQFLLRLAIFE